MKKIVTLFVIGTFSIINYNTALNQYKEGKYALSYNSLLESNAPTEAYSAFGW
jgi:hypothetical protein